MGFILELGTQALVYVFMLAVATGAVVLGCNLKKAKEASK